MKDPRLFPQAPLNAACALAPRHSFLKAGLPLLALLLLAAGCKHNDKGNSTGAADSSSAQTASATGSGSAHVSYRPNVHLVEQEAGTKAINGVSSNGAALLLDASNPQMQSLKAGDILIIKGLIAKKIIAVEPQGSEILVLTQNASLPEAIQDGQISLSAPIRFGAPQAENIPNHLGDDFFDRLTPPVYAQSTENEIAKNAEDKGTKDAYGNIFKGIKGAVIDGWTTDFSTTPGPGRLNINLNLKKDVGGFIATITGEGYVSNFDFDSNIGIEQSTYQKLDGGFKNLNGVMNFKWQVATETPGAHTGDDRIKLPAGIDIPLYRYLDGLPLYLEIGSALIIKPALSGGKEYSRGAFRITYDGYQHFSAKKGNMDTDGNVTGDIQFVEGQNISALAPMGMVVAFAAPRVELSFGISKILPFSDLKDAASKVDFLADQLAKRVLTPDQYQQFKSSLGGQISFSKAIENATKSDAAVYFEMISSAGMSFTGVSVIAPCTRHDLHLWGKVGASAEAFGQDVGKSEKIIYQKDFTRIDPPGIKLCEEVGPKS